jgi:hypothetical protein
LSGFNSVAAAGLSWSERGGAADNLTDGWDVGAVHTETAAEIVPKGQSVFAQGLGNRDEGVEAAAPLVATGAAADFALFDADADVAFGVVGVERDIGAIEHTQEFALDGEQRVENGVERGKAGVSGIEDAIEAGPQSATCGRVDAAGLGVLFERSIKLPDTVARALN